MKKRGIEKKIVSIFLMLILFLMVFYFDKEILSFFFKIRNKLLTDFFLGLTFVSSEIVVLFFLTSLFLWNEHKRRWIVPLWLTLGASVLISFLLKIIVNRARPFESGFPFSNYVIETFSSWNTSFPSFQAVLAFSALPILDKEFPIFKYFWLAIASLIALSRVYFGVHFPSDVLAGAIIGYIIGMFVVKLEEEEKFGEKIYKFFRRK